jgi:hypothetical protein
VAVVCTYVERTFVSCNNLWRLYVHMWRGPLYATSYYNLQRSSPHIYIQQPQDITTYKGPLHIFTYNSHKLLQLTKVLSTYLHTTATSYYNLQRYSPHIYIQQPQVITTYKVERTFVSYNNLWPLYVHMWREPL